MVLRISQPFKHPRTGVYYFRRAVPRDLRVTIGKWEELRSLGTKDPAEARKRHAEIAVAVEREWSAHRSPPSRSASQEELKPRELEQWSGAGLDGYAQSLGVTISDASRPQILEAMNAACVQAVQDLKCDADGGYRPVSDAGRPSSAWVPDTPSAASAGSPSGIRGVTFTALTEGWWREAKVAGTAEATRIKYARAMTRLGRFLGHDDASKVTPADVVRFKDHRLSTVDPETGKSLSASTVRSGDLAPLKAVLGWAVSNLHLPSNPAEKITLKVGKAQKLRSKAFTDAEAQALLKATTGIVRGREAPKAYAAKRWVPWLCAYTGARVGEMVQLRSQDVRQEGDLWVVHITPEAGTVKTHAARTVVLHQHLIELGFVTFANLSAAGYLFFEAENKETARRSLYSTAGLLRKSAREIVRDDRVAPNHGWRHRFKTICRDVGVGQSVMDAIQGHAGRNESDNYGDVSLQAQALALARFPRQG